MAKQSDINYIVWDNDGRPHEYCAVSDAVAIDHAKLDLGESRILKIEKVETTIIYGKDWH